MRTRKEIEKDQITAWELGKNNSAVLTVEILLDIRDLLQDKNKEKVKP